MTIRCYVITQILLDGPFKGFMIYVEGFRHFLPKHENRENNKNASYWKGNILFFVHSKRKQQRIVVEKEK
jgi:hypothetical protein